VLGVGAKGQPTAAHGDDRRRTAMTGGDSRGGRDSSEGSTRAGQQVTLGAPGSPRSGAWVIG
jgi:hypothetical protein